MADSPRTQTPCLSLQKWWITDRPRSGWHIVLGVLIWAILSHSQCIFAQLDFEKAPINYGQVQTHDPIAKFIQRLNKGEAQLEYSPKFGWLPSILENMEVPIESQVMVFSKTSLQLHRIGPRTPRAIYFNDEVYIGFCQGGDVVEIAATDPDLGGVFYTLDQSPTPQPQIIADRGQCLTCHATNRTQNVPGFLVRSIFSDANGRPRSGTRTYVTDHSSPFEQRYGGWYVTGQHGTIRHMGNVIAPDRNEPESIDREAGANLNCLDEYFDGRPYLSKHSDLVALMMLEHQSQMHNILARAAIETRIAEHYDQGINEALGRPIDTVSESTKRRIAAAGEMLVRYMLFADEERLPNPVTGTSDYCQTFESLPIPKDNQGRHLRELDLQTRLLKYPCSYLIYTEAFDALPTDMLAFVRDRLSTILNSPVVPEGYERLQLVDLQNIREILNETKPGFLTPANDFTTASR
ncbi:MAG: hypothetical protein KDB03_12635 [Planctomycetales bacterium]|nr:hypothetical protein [Planctomycetales bacterium]